MATSTHKAVRTHLLAAKTALASGDHAAATAATAAAIDADADSYDAWTFDGKARFAAGDASAALASYRAATALDASHPAAWRGTLEAAGALGDAVLELEACAALLAMPPDDKKGAITDERRLEWTLRRARAATRARRHADAIDAWNELMCWPGETQLTEELGRLALVGRAACAARLDAAARAAAGDAAEMAAAPGTRHRARTTAEGRHDAACNDALDASLEDLSDARVDAREVDAGDLFTASELDALTTTALTRAAARATHGPTPADAAIELLGECERVLARRRGDGDGDGAVARAVRAAALEAATALDLGLGPEEAGWTESPSVSTTRDAASEDALVSRVRALVQSPSTPPPDEGAGVDVVDAVAAAWTRLCDHGRTGDVMNVPGSERATTAGTLAGAAAAALEDALVAAEAELDGADAAATTITTASSDAAAAATDAPRVALGRAALALGFGAAAEASAMRGDALASLDAAKRGLRAIRAVRASGDPSTPSPRMPRLERRLKLVAAEALARVARFDEARAAFAALDPTKSPRASRGLASVVKDADEAFIAVQNAAAIAPEAPRALASFAAAFVDRGDVASAAEHLERACLLVAPDGNERALPPDIACALGIARWRGRGRGGGDAAAVAAARGRGSAHAALLAAAAATGATQATAFAHLSLVYDACDDAVRAEKCRAKALSIDASEPTAGAIAVDALLVGAGNAKRARRMCEDAMKSAPGESAWAAARLASIAHAEGDHEAAVRALQATLRASPRASRAWECLGASYDALGRHSAALKAYARAIETAADPANGGDGGERTYAAVRSGALLQQMGRARDAREMYASALYGEEGPEGGPDATAYAPALLGLAECLSLEASAAAGGGAPGRAADAARAAAAHASRAAVGAGAPKRTALKLAADAKLTESRVRDPFASVSTSARERGEAAALSAATAAAEARRLYARCAHLSPCDASARADVAAACASESCAIAERERTESSTAAAIAAVAAAERTLRAALRLDPCDPRIWTALGTLPSPSSGGAPRAPEDFAMRETALSRAVTLDPRHAPAWSALGRLYLDASRVGVEAADVAFFQSRAAKALDAARASDPDSASAWVGTALLRAATIDDAECAGAFRIASDLPNGGEGDVGRALTGAANGARDGGAYASARRAREARPVDAVAAVALGVASEVRGLAREATRAFEDAIELCDERGGGGDFESERECEIVRAAAADGLARCAARLVGATPTDGDGDADASAAIAAIARVAEAFAASGRPSVRRAAGCGASAAEAAAAFSIRAEALLSTPSGPDAVAASRALARAVHLAPDDVVVRGSLSRVLPASSSPENAWTTVRAAARCAPPTRAKAASAAARAKSRGCDPSSRARALRDVADAAAASAAAALASAPGGAHAESIAEVTAIARALSRAAHVAPDAASVRALLALASERRRATSRGSDASPLPGPAPGTNLREPPRDSDPIAIVLAAAAGAASRGEMDAAERLCRFASRSAAEAGTRAGGATPRAASAARLLLGAVLRARGDAKAAKESGKILARVCRPPALGGAGGSVARAAAALRGDGECGDDSRFRSGCSSEKKL